MGLPNEILIRILNENLIFISNNTSSCGIKIVCRILENTLCNRYYLNFIVNTRHKFSTIVSMSSTTSVDAVYKLYHLLLMRI